MNKSKSETLYDVIVLLLVVLVAIMVGYSLAEPPADLRPLGGWIITGFMVVLFRIVLKKDNNANNKRTEKDE